MRHNKAKKKKPFDVDEIGIAVAAVVLGRGNLLHDLDLQDLQIRSMEV
jgi:hypothetical protein